MAFDMLFDVLVLMKDKIIVKSNIFASLLEASIKKRAISKKISSQNLKNTVLPSSKCRLKKPKLVWRVWSSRAPTQFHLQYLETWLLLPRHSLFLFFSLFLLNNVFRQSIRSTVSSTIHTRAIDAFTVLPAQPERLRWISCAGEYELRWPYDSGQC